MGIASLFSRKAPPKEWITCPACGHEQKEYKDANATFCHACGHRISMQEEVKRSPRRVRKRVDKRVVPCIHCGTELNIHNSAMSWQCTGCSSYLDLCNHEINKESTAEILTYGNITVGKRGFLNGPRAEAETMFISGRSQSQLSCRNSLIIRDGAKVLGEAKGKLMRVVKGASLKTESMVEFQTLEVAGAMVAKQLVISGLVKIEAGGSLHADSLIFGSIEVQPGGKLHAPARSIVLGRL
jgi:DNA-directed RNA polymerase subunit RPC12/RpoP/cytoskeletal protein CcmA (bactofilin family)